MVECPCVIFLSSHMMIYIFSIQLSANYIRLKSENSSWFQYSVAYSPIIDNRGMCYKLLYMHQDVVGPARVFDGKVLFLPHQLPSKVNDGKVECY